MTPKQAKRQAELINQAIKDNAIVQHFESNIASAEAKDGLVILTSEYGNKFVLDKIARRAINILRDDPCYLRCDACGCFLELEDNVGMGCNMCPDCAIEGDKP